MGVQPIAIPPSLQYVLTSAGDRNGVDFGYLLQTAIRESSLDPTAKASTSTATGLFQFLESTWLQVMKEQGPRLGYQQYAQAIEKTADGRYDIADRAKKAEILKLRENPQIAADLAAAFTKSNGDYLQSRFGRMPSAGELYIAHFLGAQGAERMFNAGLQNPDQIAAKLFPRQADSNPTIFYAAGSARTIREVYRALVSQHSVGGGASTAFAAQQMASQPTVAQAPVVPSRLSPENMSFTGLFKTEADGPARSPLNLDGPAGSAFFTQLYNR